MVKDYKYWIERYKLQFHMYVYEQEKINIFRDINLTEVVSNSDELKGVFVDVKMVKKFFNHYYYFISYNGNDIGWVRRIHSPIVFQKKKDTIKILSIEDESKFINSNFNFTEDLISQNADKILHSRYFMIFDEYLYYSLELKDEILGFLSKDNVELFDRVHLEITSIKEKTKLFKESQLINEHSKFEKNKYTVKIVNGIFLNANLARITLDNEKFWVKYSDIVCDYSQNSKCSVDDVIIDSLLFQTQDKLQFSYKKFAMKISELETEIKSLKKTKEKNESILKEIARNLDN